MMLGGIVGWLIYRTGSTSTLHWFLVSSTCLLFLIGAGLASKAVGFFQYYAFSRAVGGDVAETGDGPGSFKVQGNVWHFTWGNPEVRPNDGRACDCLQREAELMPFSPEVSLPMEVS